MNYKLLKGTVIALIICLPFWYCVAKAQVTGTPVNNPPQVAMSVEDLALLPDLLAILDGHPIVTYRNLYTGSTKANCVTDFNLIYLDYDYITGNGQGRSYLIALGCIIHEMGHIHLSTIDEPPVIAWTREQLIRLRDERLKPPPVDVPSTLLPIYNVLLLGE